MSNQIGGKDKMLIVRLMSMVPNFFDYNNQSILHQVVSRGDKELVFEIIKNMERSRQLSDFINSKDSQGNTPLHIAVINGYDDIADLLISKGADTQIEDAKGNLVVFEKNDSPKNVKNNNDKNCDEVKELISFLVKPKEEAVKTVVQPENNYIKLNLTSEKKKEYERIRDQSPEEVNIDMLKKVYKKEEVNLKNLHLVRGLSSLYPNILRTSIKTNIGAIKNACTKLSISAGFFPSNKP